MYKSNWHVSYKQYMHLFTTGFFQDTNFLNELVTLETFLDC